MAKRLKRGRPKSTSPRIETYGLTAEQLEWLKSYAATIAPGTSAAVVLRMAVDEFRRGRA